MSNRVNDEIRERAREACEEATNSALGGELERAIAVDDLDAMRALTSAVERHMTYLDMVRDSEIA